MRGVASIAAIGLLVACGGGTANRPGDSERRGVEFLIDSNLGGGFNAYLAYTYLDAKFVERFPTCTGTCAAPNE